MRRWSAPAPTQARRPRRRGPRRADRRPRGRAQPGRANRARVNKSPLPRARELIGLVRTVVFSPEDLTLVKGDPSDRRQFLDDLLVLRTPRLAGVRADYDRVLRQRNSLLKTAGAARRGGRGQQESALATLGVWDDHLARDRRRAARRAAASWSRRCGPTSARPTRPSPAGPRATTPRSTYKPLLRPGRRHRTAPTAGRGPARRARAPPQRRARPRDLLVGPHRDELLLTLGHGRARAAARGCGCR